MERARVLAIDDDPVVRRLVEIVLEADGFDVDVAADAAEARAFLRRDGRPDLFLRDLDAPLFFEREHGFNQVERIGVEVFLEPGVGDDLYLVHRELLGEHLLHPGLDLCTIGHRYRSSWLFRLVLGMYRVVAGQPIR